MSFFCKNVAHPGSILIRYRSSFLVWQIKSLSLPLAKGRKAGYRLFASYSGDIPCTMRRWEISEYGSINNLTLNNCANVPDDLKPDEILLKVFASSVNPIDIEMSEGYGSAAINTLRRLYGVKEFPLVLGRDGSGVVVKTGRNVKRFKIGDQVWCARWILGDGTHAEYSVVSQSEAAIKPRALSHSEAASLPYVSCTVWAALIGIGGLDPDNLNNKNILILGGSGGVGTFAIQLAKVLGNNVTATCLKENFDLVKKHGALTVIDYQSETYESEINSNGPYDIILDASKEGQTKKLGGNSKSIYITLMPPFLPSIDQHGLAKGLLFSGKEFVETNLRHLLQGQGKYAWGFFYPNGGILKRVAELVDDGKICPVIDSVNDFADAKIAFDHVKNGQTRGKVILKLCS